MTAKNSSAQASNRLRFASFPIHPEPTTLEPGVHRFPLNFLIKPEYAPSYTTSYGGIRYRLKATLDYEPSLLMRLKEPIGTSQIRVEKDVWVGKRIMRPETLPVYSTGSAEDDVSPDSSEADEWDMRQKVMDMKVATLAFKTMRQILLVPEVSMQAIPLNATLSVQAGASFTLKSISFGLKETTRNKAHICESTYPNSKSIYAIIKEEKRYLIGPHVHPPIDPKTTSSIKLHLFVPTDAHTIWRDDIQAEYINTTHFIKIECDAVVDGKAQSFKMEIPIGVFGCRSDFKNPKYRGFVM
ncbi:hypothetical protein DFS34DRAFT_469319 [Phlyctochytrium arcticum]|nr:hypothetical protein DFS34DRAFT_469319 [Phlyctochytrium arcticum]